MIRKSRLRAPAVVALLLLTTTTVYANAGSGFLLPGIIHILIGNVIIGFIEAAFVRRVFKIPVRYGFIIFGNYVSAIIGYIAAVLISSGYDLISALAALFVASVLIEWPFFVWAVKDKTLTFSRTSLKYTVYAQCVSYVLLIPYHFLFYDVGRIPASVYVEDNLTNLAANAYEHRLHVRWYGGGGGSYRRFSISPGMAGDTFARYTASVSKDSIVFKAATADGKLFASVVLDSAGELHSWKNFQAMVGGSGETVSRSLKSLGRIAHEYRKSPFLPPDNPGSYLGYTVPEIMSRDLHARYDAIVISRDSIVFRATLEEDSTSTVTAVLDSTGRLHSWRHTGPFER